MAEFDSHANLEEWSVELAASGENAVRQAYHRSQQRRSSSPSAQGQPYVSDQHERDFAARLKAVLQPKQVADALLAESASEPPPPAGTVLRGEPGSESEYASFVLLRDVSWKAGIRWAPDASASPSKRPADRGSSTSPDVNIDRVAPATYASKNPSPTLHGGRKSPRGKQSWESLLKQGSHRAVAPPSQISKLLSSIESLELPASDARHPSRKLLAPNAASMASAAAHPARLPPISPTHHSPTHARGAPERPGPVRSDVSYKADGDHAANVTLRSRIAPSDYHVGSSPVRPLPRVAAQYATYYSPSEKLWRTVLFPADRPGGRRDAELLQSWYETSLKSWIKQSSTSVSCTSTQFQQLVSVHCICLNELARLTWSHCEVQGNLMSTVLRNHVMLADVALTRAMEELERRYRAITGSFEQQNDDKQKTMHRLARNNAALLRRLVNSDEQVRPMGAHARA